MTRRLALLTLLAAILAVAVAHAEVITGGNVHVSFGGSMTPRTLPRSSPVPISLSVEGSVDPIGDRRPPALRRILVAVNRHARLSTRGLPVCPRRSLASLTTRQALSVCRSALVGDGHFRAHIDIPDQAPFPSLGRALIFNSRLRGHPALLVHVYGPNPVSTVEILPLSYWRRSAGNFGLNLSAEMPDVGNQWGYVTNFDLTLGRIFRFHGREHSLLSASCPAPPGIFTVSFELARGTFYLANGQTRNRLLTGVCHPDHLHHPRQQRPRSSYRQRRRAGLDQGHRHRDRRDRGRLRILRRG